MISITVDNVIDAIADFIQPLVGDTVPIVRGQVNRTAMPDGGFVLLTELLTQDLETPIESLDSTGLIRTSATPARFDVQVDFYGELAGDWANTLRVLWRSRGTAAQFPVDIKPLYMSNPLQAPMTNSEQQWQSRWTTTVSLQYNGSVSLSHQSANTLALNRFEAGDLQ